MFPKEIRSSSWLIHLIVKMNKDYKPKVVFVDDENKIEKISSYEKHGKLY